MQTTRPDSTRPKVVALVWGQFAAYHVDRCEAVAARLGETCDVVAVEVATASGDYAWEPSGEVSGARKLTLFPGRTYESVAGIRRFWALLRALRKVDWALIGVPYSGRAIILLAWVLRLFRVRPVMLTESKADDLARRPLREWLKAVLLSPYVAAIVGGTRSFAYARQLGFRKRRVLPGYDGVGLERVRRHGNEAAPAGPLFEERPFIFVGRFIAKKNLAALIRAYARYREIASGRLRGLVLVGDGPQRAELERLAAELGVSRYVEFAGFLPAPMVSQRLSGGLALLLVSTEEQWGLVVNEALAFNLPAIVSFPVGARDALVRNGVNGYVVDPGSVEEIARAMVSVSSNRQEWQRMCAESQARAWLGDAERFADAVDKLVTGGSVETQDRITRFAGELGVDLG